MKNKNVMNKGNITAIEYSLVTIVCTAIIGKIIIIVFPRGNNIWASVLFILVNLLPMIVAVVFSLMKKEAKNVREFLKKAFLQREAFLAYMFAIATVVLYYGISILLNNVNYTGNSFLSILAYLPWALLQGGLEEVGWRGYLQTHLNIENNLILNFLMISIVWFVWHLPLYQLPWITSASSNYFIFYLLILGNTFMLGAVKEVSKGTLPCVVAHMLIDSLAMIMLVQSKIFPILILVVIEVAVSLLAIKLIKNRSRI